MTDFKVVGTPVARSEGAEKVSGRTLYGADVALPGLLWGKILRSPHPHARIRRVDTAKARRVPGIQAVIAGTEIPQHYIGKQIRDMPVLCWDVARRSCMKTLADTTACRKTSSRPICRTA